MDPESQKLAVFMKEMVQDLQKVQEGIMSRTIPSAADEPAYTGFGTPGMEEEAEAFDYLVDALANISDAWYCIHRSLKKSVYYEEDEWDVEKMRDQLRKMEKQLTQMLERRGIL